LLGFGSLEPERTAAFPSDRERRRHRRLTRGLRYGSNWPPILKDEQVALSAYAMFRVVRAKSLFFRTQPESNDFIDCLKEMTIDLNSGRKDNVKYTHDDMNDNGCILNFTNLDEAKTSF
jgi:hypothetical protein